MKSQSFAFFACLPLAAAVASCSRAPAHPQAPVPDTAGAVAAIRALGAHYASSVQVNPVRDAALDGFIAEAHALEAQGDFAAARARTEAALKIAPRAPDILQYAAELAVEAGDWQQAGTLARQSYEAGARVGGLCARNLETLARALVVAGDAAQAQAQRERIADCAVPPVTRF